jgi:group II intron reverse transcriptase/maturase
MRNPFRKQQPDYPPWESAFSLNALRRAWQMVRANGGRGGPDGETVAQFEVGLEKNLRQLRQELLEKSYRPHRVTQILVPKPSGGWRPLTLWAIRDRVAQRAVHDYLEPIFENCFLPCSYGFRPGRKVGDAAQAIVQAHRAGACWVLDADIKDCFGQMEQAALFRQLRRWRVPWAIQTLIQRWFKARVWNAWRGAKAAGTSQGGVISPLLCNIYLHPFDEQMQNRGWRLVRYADDFVVLAREEASVKRASEQAAGALRQMGLEIHPQKTRLTNFEEGFQFVGWFFVGDEAYQLK